eukprot:1673501-Prymnesium_polylepis.1
MCRSLDVLTTIPTPCWCSHRNATAKTERPCVLAMRSSSGSPSSCEGRAPSDESDCRATPRAAIDLYATSLLHRFT